MRFPRIVAALILPGLSIVLSGVPHQDEAPDKCDETRATLLVLEQIEGAAAIADPVRRLEVVVAANDLLWDIDEERGRAGFASAWEEAVEIKSEAAGKGGARSRRDPRLVVVRAVSRRDAEWGSRLIDLIALERQAEGDEVTSQDIIGGAISILDIDQKVGLALAARVLDYPPSLEFGWFLYRVAQADQSAGDELYRAALERYSGAPPHQLLYLSAYPFGRDRYFGPEALSILLQAPPGFAPNPALRTAFISRMLASATAALTGPDAPAGGAYNLTPAAQLHLALLEIERFAAAEMPEWRAELLEAISALASRIGPEQLRGNFAILNQRSRSTAEILESRLADADQASSSDQRDSHLALAVLENARVESLDRLSPIAAKIRNLKLRSDIEDWLFYTKARSLAQEGRVDEARPLADRISAVEFRALILLELASIAIEDLQDSRRAAEILDGVLAEARKAADSTEKARTLLGVADLFGRFDHVRSFETLTESIKVINTQESPDLQSVRVERRIVGPTFRHYTLYDVSAQRIDRVFEIVAPNDFEGALLLARSLEDPALRASGVLAVVRACLRQRGANERQRSG